MVIAKIRYIKKVIELENQKSELWAEIYNLDDTIVDLGEKILWHKIMHTVSGLVIAFLLFSHHLV